MKKKTPTFRSRAKAGAAYLDEVSPEWYSKIDTAKLDMNEPCLCILGQIYGNYYEQEIRSENKLWKMGFTLFDREFDDEVMVENFRQLQGHWINEIKARLEYSPTENEHAQELVGAI